MTALEAEKGVKCTFLHPNPGYVIKTRGLDDHVKAFVNVCFDDNVGMPELISPPQPIAAASPKPARTKAAAARKGAGSAGHCLTSRLSLTRSGTLTGKSATSMT